MKNYIICNNCNKHNPHYKLNCSNCNSYLRERVFNIDFWKTLWFQMDSPEKAYKIVVYAEHKNLLYFLLCIFILKLSLVNYAFNNYYEISFFTNMPILNFVLAGAISILLITYIWISSKVLGAFGYKTKFKDNLSIVIYAMLPFILSLIIFTPLEYAILGKYFFTFETEPWIIKKYPAYAFYFLEGAFLLYSVFQLYLGFKFQIKNNFYSIMNVLKITSIFFLYYIIILFIY